MKVFPLILGLYSSKNISTEFFEQYINHQNRETFKQRYYINDKYYEKNQKVVLYLGGEGSLKNVSVTKGLAIRLAEENQALLLSLEHRYYGVSHPYKDTKTENLRYLSSEMALKDIEHFIIKMNDKYNLTESKRRWIVLGGSYPGNLAAWSRQQLPDLVYASLASSAPIQVKEDFYEYDLVVQKAIGPECTKKVEKVKDNIDNQYGNRNRFLELKKTFNCTEVENDKLFLEVLADSLADIVQYNKRGDLTVDSFCDSLEKENQTETLIKSIASNYQKLHNGKNRTCLSFSGIDELKNTTIDEDKSTRQWTYQVCNEFGYYQSAPNLPTYHSTRSKYLTKDWFNEFYCGSHIYKKRIGPPNTQKINRKYGGKQGKFNKVIFTNGDLDPWSFLSLNDTRKSTLDVPIFIIKDGSHANDLYASNSKDSKSLNDTRDSIATIISTWFNE